MVSGKHSQLPSARDIQEQLCSMQILKFTVAPETSTATAKYLRLLLTAILCIKVAELSFRLRSPTGGVQPRSEDEGLFW